MIDLHTYCLSENWNQIAWMNKLNVCNQNIIKLERIDFYYKR